MDVSSSDVTRLLIELRVRGREATEKLFDLLYVELRRIELHTGWGMVAAFQHNSPLEQYQFLTLRNQNGANSPQYTSHILSFCPCPGASGPRSTPYRTSLRPSAHR